MDPKRNERRCDLIDREVNGTITADEADELKILMNELYEWRKQVRGLVAMEKKTSWDIAVEWYSVEEIERSIQRSLNSSIFDSSIATIPQDVQSPDFAEWLTQQYRYAMAKGIQLAQGDGELRAAIKRGGFDVSPCRLCGETVVCIPDGLPCCEECGKEENMKWL